MRLKGEAFIKSSFKITQEALRRRGSITHTLASEDVPSVRTLYALCKLLAIDEKPVRFKKQTGSALSSSMIQLTFNVVGWQKLDPPLKQSPTWQSRPPKP